MAIQIQGNGGTVAEVDGTGFRALRVSPRPLDVGSLGSYRKSLLSGTMAAALAANAEIMQFRWADATRFCAVRRVTLDGLSGSATAFTAGFGKVDLMVARAWTSDGSGGTLGTLTGNNGKMRTSHGAPLLGAMRVSSTAALTIGTKTLDTDPIGLISLTFGVAASQQYANQTVLFDDADGKHPLLLAQNEGLAARATVPATGTWQFGMTVVWDELAAY
jgi:hypothetical protein